MAMAEKVRHGRGHYHTSLTSLTDISISKTINKQDRRYLYQTQDLSSLCVRKKDSDADQLVDTTDNNSENESQQKDCDDIRGKKLDMDVLLNAESLVTLMSHKLDIIVRSLKLLDENCSDMCHQAMTDTTKNESLRTLCLSHHSCEVDVESCDTTEDSHADNSSSELMKSLCDLDRCDVCEKLHSKLGIKRSHGKHNSRIDSRLSCSYTIHDISQQLLLEGAVAISGGETELLISVFTLIFDWTERKDIVRELSSLLIFILQFHRNERITVILDARRSSRSLLKQLMESLQDAQRCSGNAIDVARVLIDRPSQTGTIVKSVRGSSALPVDILTSTKSLQNYTTPKILPRQLGGEQKFDAQQYVTFHQELHAQVTHYTESLNGALIASHSLSQVPQSLTQCSQLITHHQQTLQLLDSEHHGLLNLHHASGNYSTLPNPRPRGATPQVTPRLSCRNIREECSIPDINLIGDYKHNPSSPIEHEAYASSPQLNISSRYVSDTLPIPRKQHPARHKSHNIRSLYSSDTLLPRSFSAHRRGSVDECTYDQIQSNQSSPPIPASRPKLADLLHQYPETRKILGDLDKFTRGTEIYRHIMENLNTLATVATDVTRLKILAEERLKKLYGLEKIWFYIEEITKTLNLLKRAHEVINRHRSISSNLKAATYQLKSFHKIQLKVESLLSRGTDLLSDVTDALSVSPTHISWLEQLVTKLGAEISFITSLHDKTIHLVTSTHDCYVKLDQVYDWALDAMKLMSQDSMDNYMTPEALELLASSLKSFMEQKSFIDDATFDEISKEARFLSNRKLSDQCKMAKRRCSETRHLLNNRWELVMKKQEELWESSTENIGSPIHQSGTSSGDVQSWQPNFTRSAPPTPALTLRCNNNVEVKRRSQSIDDDLANQVLQLIENEQVRETNLEISANSMPVHSSHENLSQCLETASHQPEDTTPEALVSDIHQDSSPQTESPVPAPRNVVECTDLYQSECTNTKDDYGDNTPDGENNYFIKPETDSPNDSASPSNSSCDPTSPGSISSISHKQDGASPTWNHTVYRGDKVLEQEKDITIPLDQDLHLNNNFLVITSPTIESKGIIYTPPRPAMRPSLSVHHSKLVDSDSPQSPILDTCDGDTAGIEDIPRVTFIDGADVISAEASPCEEVCLISIDTGTTLAEPASVSQSKCKLSPVLSLKQKQKAMQKRRSFHGFTAAIKTPIMNFAKNWKNAEDSIKRLSVGSNVSEDGELTSEHTSRISESETQETSAARTHHSESSFKERDNSKFYKNKRMDKTLSLVTASSESLPSLPEDDVIEHNPLSRQRQSKQWSPIPVNSHLMNKRVLPSHRSTSMADLRLTESEIKSRIMLAHIMDELIQTERDYVESLGLVVDRYIPEMLREDVPQTLRGKRAVIFGNIEKIHEFHGRYFLTDIAKCENEPFKISQCFLRHEAEFLMYALYNKNKPKSDLLMSEHGAEFFREQQSEMGDKMDLSSYLLKPVQRMGKYALILKQVLKECPESAAEYQDLVQAEEMIRFCLQHGNDLLAMDALEDCDVNLQEQGTLILQDEFYIIKNKKRLLRHVFLFEQLLLFSKTKHIGAGRDQYTYKNSVKTADLGLTENVGTSGLKFEVWFRKRTGDSWMFQATCPQIKNRWVNVIEKLLWTQALKNREYRLTELTTMGVGNKPSLDLKKSADNINDRFIPSLGKSSNIAGNRHSLDSLHNSDSFDMTKKRPYSVISLANSSSSSGSSSGSTGPGTGTRRNPPWADLKAVVTGRGQQTSRSRRIQKLYKSDSRINSRCDDSGISSSSDLGVITTYFSSPRSPSSTEIRKGSETEV